MTKYLLDTNILIYALNGVSPWNNLVISWARENRLLISAMVLAEVLVGARYKEKEAIKHLAKNSRIVAIDQKVAEEGARLRKRYGKKLDDMLIAASAQISKATLVTVNVADFPMKNVKKFKVHE